jgi:DnaD/phage-associated family protein
VNYLKELNAFYDRLETNPLSTSAIALWHSLMHINNKAGWVDEFAVAASVLCIKSGLKDSMFKKARNELSQKEYITFKSRGGNQSAIYQITLLSSHCDRSSDHNGVYSGVHSSDHIGVPLNKLNKTKLNETDKEEVEDRPMTMYQSFVNNFGYEPTPTQIHLLGSYIDQDNMQEELIIWALRETGERGKPFEYARSTLNRLSSSKIKTVTGAEKAKEEHNRKKVRGFNRNASHSKRTISDSRDEYAELSL